MRYCRATKLLEKTITKRAGHTGMRKATQFFPNRARGHAPPPRPNILKKERLRDPAGQPPAGFFSIPRLPGQPKPSIKTRRPQRPAQEIPCANRPNRALKPPPAEESPAKLIPYPRPRSLRAERFRECISGFDRTPRTNPHPFQPGGSLGADRLHFGIIFKGLVDDPAFVGIHRG